MSDAAQCGAHRGAQGRRQNAVDLRRDAATGIETIRAHFEGHAYDPHWHDSYLLGVTDQGVQQFDCRGRRIASRPGQVFMLEPGEIHNGDAPGDGGFTYRMLYLPTDWLRAASTRWRAASMLQHGDLYLAQPQVDDAALATAIGTVFDVLREAPSATPRIFQDAAFDTLLERLMAHGRFGSGARRHPFGAADGEIPRVRTSRDTATSSVALALRARDALHAHLDVDIGLDALAACCETDRFTLTRGFKAYFGIAPHAYLVQLRLATARARLARGEPVATVAHAVGFADQSHLGRWFRRAYGLPPAKYRHAAQTFQTSPDDAR